jgi:hypothetical protein
MFSQTPANLKKGNFKQPQGKYAKMIQAVIDSYDQFEGMRTLEQEKIIHTQKAAALRSKALKMNIPIIRINEDGTESLLIAFLEGDKPLYYSIDNVDAAESTRTDHLHTGGSLGLNLNGDDLTAHVWDGGPVRPTHQEFDGAGGANRLTINDGVTTLNGNSFHAMHVSGTIGASGFQAAAKGMAWQANVLAHDWDSDDVEARAEAMSGMLISNHSYGIPFTSVDTEFPYYPGQYNSASTEWDDIMYDYPFYLMVKSAGNHGNSTGGTAPLEGNIQFDKLTGNANAKNNLVIVNAQDANVDGSGNLISVTRNSGSSEGPTDDLRVKPDIAGNGTGLYSSYDNSDSAYNTISGTSMSAPNVTGTLLLLQDHNANVNSAFMRAATLKGLALHTADDVSGAGPDAEWGWGLLNAKAAAEAITNADAANGAIIEENTLNNGTSYSINVQSDGVNPLLASISWTDPAGTPDNSTTPNVGTPVLVHDLDIRLSNGSTFYPWRLTSVNTKSNDSNSGNGNLVDPYERIDISVPAGIYTLTVSHKGALSVPQAYSLIVTGANLAPSIPEISFSTILGTQVENSECGFVDVTIPVTIASAPSVAATVDFTVSGSGSGTDNEDFSLETSTLTFPTGSAAAQNITLRVYHDSFLEGDETAIIDFTVNDNGGDAFANTAADQFTLTITNDDAIPTEAINVTLFSEDMVGPGFQVETNFNGDGTTDAFSFGNTAAATSAYWTTSGNSSQFAFTNDDACNCDKSFNFLNTNAIDMSGAYDSALLTFDHAFSNIAPETGQVLISTDAGASTNLVLTLTNTSTTLGGSAYSSPWVNGVTVDMTPYIGEPDVRVYFVYSDGNNWSYGMAIDNIVVTAEGGSEVQTAVNIGGGTQDDLTIYKDGTVYSSDATTGNVMATIVNNQADDYGCTTVAVNRDGTNAQAYNGSVAPNLVMDKRFTISPTNTIGAGDVTLTFYFSQAEIDGWISDTGLLVGDLVAGRGNSTSISETANLTVGSFGTNVTLTGNFTGLDGEFYFGTSDSFVAPCAGGLKTWVAGAWSPLGLPNASNSVVISDAYNTAINGDIEACSLTVSSGVIVTIPANTYVRSVGNITVEVSGTLIVAHQGSLVQIDNVATVTNNGTIQVQVTTPTLDPRDFMLIGSPMSTEVREDLVGFRMLQHATSDFDPNTVIQGLFPDGTNFTDDDLAGQAGFDWTPNSGLLNPGEGYYYIPGPDLQTGGSYDLVFDTGTLNNGIINYATEVGDTQNDSPNVLSNPYPSGIDTALFIGANAAVNEVYFWNHDTNPGATFPGSDDSYYNMADISVFNTLGGAQTGPSIIATGQGFGIKAASNDAIVFNNSMRVLTGNTTLRTPESEVNKLWLEVTNDIYDLKSGILIGFTSMATAAYEALYDSKRIAASLSLYSTIGADAQGYAIQGREAFDSAMTVPLGFQSLVDELATYTITLNDVEGLAWEEAGIYLVDRYTNEVINLDENAYTFSSPRGNFADRFILQFENEAVLDVANNLLDTVRLFPNPTNDLLQITSSRTLIKSTTIYDMQGRIVQENEFDLRESVQLNLGILKSAIYFVTIATEDGTITKRVLKK